MGLQVPVSAPEDQSIVLPVFVKLFSFVKAGFSMARTEAEQDAFFIELFDRCDDAHEELESLDGMVVVPFDAFQLLVNLKQDLVVWSPSKTQPRRNPRAGPERHERPTL